MMSLVDSKFIANSVKIDCTVTNINFVALAQIWDRRCLIFIDNYRYFRLGATAQAGVGGLSILFGISATSADSTPTVSTSG
jgi:hypothetical protein